MCCMATCPECEYRAEPSGDWLEEIMDEEVGHRGRTICLVVCPECDVVLGGTDTEWVAAY